MCTNQALDLDRLLANLPTATERSQRPPSNDLPHERPIFACRKVRERRLDARKCLGQREVLHFRVELVVDGAEPVAGDIDTNSVLDVA